MNKAAYPVVVQALCKEDGGGFIAIAPDLVGCIGDGDTPQEAVTCLLEAMDEYADEIKRLGRQLPTPFSNTDALEKEEESLRKLVRAQADLIASQKELLSKQDASLRELTETVALLSENVRIEQETLLVDENICVHAEMWPRSLRLIRAAPMAKKQRGGFKRTVQISH